MENCITSRQIMPSNYDVFVGMDVDKRSIALTSVNHLGLKKSVKMNYEADGVLSYIQGRYPGRRVAFVYEAGPTGFGLYESIVDAGFPCLIVSPASVPTARGKRVKTNRLDSIKLADLLRGGQLSGIRVPSQKYRDLRDLTQLRNIYVEQVRATKYRIKGFLLKNGIAFPAAPASSQWSKRVILELRSLECGNAARFKIDSLLDNLEWAHKQALKTQLALRRMLEADEELSESMGFLMSLPGIGWIIASMTLARVGDWRRLRSMLIQGAWTAIRKDPELADFFRRVCDNHPRNIASKVAITAVARKLAVRMHCVLKERRSYEQRTA
jgi:transposase